MDPVSADYIYRHELDCTWCTTGTSGKSLDTAVSLSRCHTMDCKWCAVLSKALLMASIISHTCFGGSFTHSYGLPTSFFKLKLGKTTT